MSASGESFALPSGYLEAEFLESSGKERILLDAKMGSDARIEMDTEFTVYKDYGGMFGSEVPKASSSYGSKRFSIMVTTKTAIRIDYGSKMTGLNVSIPFNKKIRLVKDGPLNYIDGELVHEDVAQSFTGVNCVLFAREYLADGRGAAGRMWWCKIYNNNELVSDLLPAIDPQGVPCMFDKATETPYCNLASGAFIVGLTLKQARKLRLPATGGTLTVSLPSGYESDAGVVSALETARANGWTLTVQTYTPEAESSGATTFGMRRIWVRKTQDENGAYIDADEKRWQVDWCVEMYTPDGSEPDAHGYELFRSVEVATEYWGLTPYVDPEAEELLLESQEQ